jgi:hypothetical protein
MDAAVVIKRKTKETMNEHIGPVSSKPRHLPLTSVVP